MAVDFGRFPRVSLAHLPTLLERLPNLSAALGGPTIFVKRDDCTGLALGGNKARKLEFLMGEAVAAGADTVITTGALQSNHARQTAAAARKLGFGCDLILADLVPGMGEDNAVSGNLLLDALFGATVHRLPDGAEIGRVMDEVAERRRREGRKPFLIPLGGSTPIGALGYVAAVDEILRQAQQLKIKIDHIVLASSSGGTLAGTLAGLRMAKTDISVVAVCVYDRRSPHEERVLSIADETTKLLGIDRRASIRAQFFDEYLGDGYGRPTAGMREAVILAAQNDGLLLDPVYTGKAMAGLIDLVRKGFFRNSDTVLFLHTGGTPGLFAYRPIFFAGRGESSRSSEIR